MVNVLTQFIFNNVRLVANLYTSQKWKKMLVVAGGFFIFLSGVFVCAIELQNYISPSCTIRKFACKKQGFSLKKQQRIKRNRLFSLQQKQINPF